MVEKTEPQELRLRFRVALFKRWADTDPTVAMTWAQRLSGATDRQQAIREVVAAWAGQDGASAGAWVRQLPAGPLKNSCIGLVISAWAETAPQSALDLLESSPPSREADSDLSSVFNAWAKLDPRAAAASASRLPAERFGSDSRREAIREVVQIWSESEPLAALEWVRGLPEE